MSTSEVEGLEWSTDRLIPGFQAVTSLTVCDASGASNETLTTLSTLIGLVNRPQPEIYLVLTADDMFWLKEVLADIPQTALSVTGDNTLGMLLASYVSSIKGVVIYDPSLKDSINIAIMIAAQQDGIAVSPAQVTALQDTYHFPVLSDLRTFGWKSRLQAYHWALQNLRAGCSSRLVAGLAIGNINLLAFLVATRTFIYSLDSRDYLPGPASLFTDGLLSERELMHQILATYPAGATHLGWFADESSGVNLTSQVAMTVLATDHFTNLEVWSALAPKSTQFLQDPFEKDGTLLATNAVYVSFTISDGDNLQFSQHRMKNIWQDAARGSLPIGWTLSPSLLHAAPRMAEYYLTTATSNDEFIAGPSGAGYMFPSHWPTEALDAFLQMTGKHMQSMHMTSLEVLDTDYWQSSGLPFVSNIRQTGMIFSDMECVSRYVQALKPFGLLGVLSGAGLRKLETKVVDGVPFYQNIGLADSVNGTVRMIRNAVNRVQGQRRPLFLNIYMLAWKIGPSDLKAIAQQLGSGYEIVLPKTLLALLAQASARVLE